jgi:hypothetical protein
MELDKGEVEFDMGKLFLLGNNRVDHIVERSMDEMHLGILLGLVVLAGLAMRCIFIHRTGTIDGTIHDNTDFLPGLGSDGGRGL